METPRPGIEPGSPAWQAGILTSILSRIGQDDKFRLQPCSFKCWSNICCHLGMCTVHTVLNTCPTYNFWLIASKSFYFLSLLMVFSRVTALQCGSHTQQRHEIWHSKGAGNPHQPLHGYQECFPHPAKFCILQLLQRQMWSGIMIWQSYLYFWWIWIEIGTENYTLASFKNQYGD